MVGESRHGSSIFWGRRYHLEFEIAVLARRPVQSAISRKPEIVLSVEEQRVDLIRNRRIAHAKIDELPPHARRGFIWMRGWNFPWIVYQTGHAAAIGPDP